MAFIYKELIKNNYERCAELLDKFDEVQIKTLYAYLQAINARDNTYKMMSFASRTANLLYLINLKNNENGCEERMVAEKFHDIFIFMHALALLKINYQMNEYFKDNKI